MKRPFVLVVILVAVAVAPSAPASAPAGRYTITAGTVYDARTQLTWQQTSPSGTYTFGGSAHPYCAGLSLNGTGWRLPTLKELQSLVDYTVSTGTLIDGSAFPGTPADNFWSSTSFVGGTPSPSAWYVSFATGATSKDGFTVAYDVRCVR